jgi:hypothetical protein
MLRRMPMIDVYAAAGTFSEQHRLAQDLARDKQLGPVKELTEIVARAVLAGGD